VTASSHIAALNSDAHFGDNTGSLAIAVNPATGNSTGDLKLADTTVPFNLFGFISGTATVRVIPAGKTTGTYSGGVATFHSADTIRLTSLSVLGRTVLSGSTTCQTGVPADIVVKSGANFLLTDGGSLTGDYTIPQFTGCGSLTPFVSALAAGPGNTASVWLVPMS
jgi:hypothetical protein